MKAVLAIVLIAALAIAVYRWYRASLRKWTWQAVETICMGARVWLARRYETRYRSEVAPRIASAVIARLLLLEEGLPYTWNTLSMAREAPASAVEHELRNLDIDENVRRGLVYAAYGVFQARRLSASMEAATAFLDDLEKRGLPWRDIPMPHIREFLDFASAYRSDSFALLANDAFAQTDRELSELLNRLNFKDPSQSNPP